MQIALAPCTPADSDFAFTVTEAAMRVYVEQAFGPWDAIDQRDGRRQGRSSLVSQTERTCRPRMRPISVGVARAHQRAAELGFLTR
jgi:hypothetical protein